MAAPAFRSISAQVQGNGATLVLDKPTGLADGDVLVMTAFVDGANTVTAAPSGFAQTGGSPVNVATGIGGAHSSVAYWKRVSSAAGEPANYTWTLASNAYRNGVLAAYSSCVASGDPWDATTSAHTDSNSAAAPDVAVTTLGPDRLLVYSATNWGGGSWTPPTSFAERVDGGDGVHTTDDLAKATAGASGNVHATSSGAAPTSSWLGALIGTTSGGHTIAVGTAAETDSSVALARTKTRALGAAAETDTAVTAGRRKTRALGVAAEVDTAVALARSKSRALGVAVDASTARPLAPAKTRLLGTAAETDTAGAMGGAGRATVHRPNTGTITRPNTGTIHRP